MRIYFLERACTMQIRTRANGGTESDYHPPELAIEKNAALAKSGGMSQLAERLVWRALLRKLDRMSPDFRE
ncbi:hypothetical protein [uncultured Bradyrhizobium sp.]|uniref:hypothetical protein n=1 Tax=Bradyrhizobium sp. TaxID=376 RepID=UPI00261930CA|nr:hypothetical protein [uncultured Bradyrhizobium sp.]